MLFDNNPVTVLLEWIKLSQAQVHPRAWPGRNPGPLQHQTIQKHAAVVQRAHSTA